MSNTISIYDKILITKLFKFFLYINKWWIISDKVIFIFYIIIFTFRNCQKKKISVNCYCDDLYL